MNHEDRLLRNQLIILASAFVVVIVIIILGLTGVIQ